MTNEERLHIFDILWIFTLCRQHNVSIKFSYETALYGQPKYRIELSRDPYYSVTYFTSDQLQKDNPYAMYAIENMIHEIDTKEMFNLQTMVRAEISASTVEKESTNV